MRECDAADDAAKDAATGDKTASLDSDDGKTLAEALRLLQVADGLLYELNDPANDPKITSEMNDLVQFYNVSRYEAGRRVLKEPLTFAWDLCPTLKAALNHIWSHSYAKQMAAKTYNKPGRDNEKVAEQKKNWQAKQDIRTMAELSTLIRRRDMHCVPPLTLMKSIEMYRINLPRGEWARHQRELSVMSRSYTEQVISAWQDFRPEPLFRLPSDKISLDYGYGVYDNLEFWLPVDEPRMKDGVMEFSKVLHTTTCESTNFCTAPVLLPSENATAQKSIRKMF